jgi:hypothetical protein
MTLIFNMRFLCLPGKEFIFFQGPRRIGEYYYTIFYQK